MTDDKPLSLSVINKSVEAELRQGACPERKVGEVQLDSEQEGWQRNRASLGKPPSQANHENKGGHEHSMVCWVWIKQKAMGT